MAIAILLRQVRLNLSIKRPFVSRSSSRLTAKQLQAIALMIEGQSYTAIAEALGVSTRTVRRWADLPEVENAVQSGKSKAVDVVVELASDKYKKVIEALIPKALMTLKDTLSDSGGRTSDKLRACQILGKWYGLEKSPVFVGDKSQTQPEETLKGYLDYIAANNGNGSH